jgi:hypothetical protein
MISALVGGEWSASRPRRFIPRERTPDTHWIGGWVDPKAGLDIVEKRKFLTLPKIELRILCRPARIECMRVRSQKRYTSWIARRINITFYAYKIFQVPLNRFPSLQDMSIKQIKLEFLAGVTEEILCSGTFPLVYSLLLAWFSLRPWRQRQCVPPKFQ